MDACCQTGPQKSRGQRLEISSIICPARMCALGISLTYLACALAQQACRQGHRALYRRVPRLFDELTLAHADGTYLRLLARLARADVLVLDDWGLGGLRDQDRRDLLEILEDRTGTRARHHGIVPSRQRGLSPALSERVFVPA